MSAEQPVPAAPQAEMPDLARCELEQELGTTTEGPTVVVRDPASGRRFVLKIYDKSVLRDPDFIQRVHRDAALASRIVHPNVVRVLGAREWLGDLVVIREHVEGAALADVLKAKGKLGTQEALSVALAAAMALQQGQKAGLTHEAVSPTNLLVARDGSVKLADLGVAKPHPIEPSVAKTGPGVRAPFYLPPEYFEVRARLDARSDLFSLGAVLYHCLSGKHPFQGDTTAEVTFAIRNGICRPLREAAPEAPRSLATIVEKLIQKNPAERYESPEALLADLQAVQAGRVPDAQRKAVAEAIREKQEAAARPPAPEPAAAQSPAAAQPEPEAPAPSRRWTFLAAGAIALVLAALFVSLVLRGRPKAPARKADDTSTADPLDPDDPAARARKAREELEALRKSVAPPKGADPAAALAAAQEHVRKLKEFAERYKDSPEAADAAKDLAAQEAEASFQAALVFARDHPKDREGLARLLRDIMAKHAKTEAGYKAERRLDELEDTERKRLQAQLDAARGKARDLTAKRRFGEALAAFDELLAANPPEAIKQTILLEKNAVLSEAERAWAALQQRAQERISANYYEEAKALYEQAAAFGIEPFVGRARAELAVLAPLLKSAAVKRLEAIDAAKYQFFLSRLEPSLVQARTWELGDAAAEAEKIRPEMKTAGIEAYLDAYLGDLALLASLKVRVLQRLNDTARPLAVRDFSLGKLGGKFDPQWLDARVLRADDAEVVFRYGEIEVRRPWAKFAPDELYKLGVLATDLNDPQSHLALGVHCLYAGLPSIASRELNLAKAGAPEAAAAYLQRLDAVLAREKTAATPAAGPQEEASRLFLEAKRYMNEQAWDRALYRLALLRERHASKVYDVTANLDEINQRIAQCKKQVEKLELETNLALGRDAMPLRESLFDEWQQRFGAWTLDKGVLTGKNPEAHDAECLFTLRHPPAYELRASVRVIEGTGAIIRLAGKGRPNIGFWLHVAKPDLVGLILEQPTDQQAAERRVQPFTFKPGEWYEIRATVSPVSVEVAIGPNYAVRMPNKLPPDPAGTHTYGFVLNPKSSAEFRGFAIRTLREQ